MPLVTAYSFLIKCVKEKNMYIVTQQIPKLHGIIIYQGHTSMHIQVDRLVNKE